jgi:predicted lipoprotein with Yx(FWY)xxD motif
MKATVLLRTGALVISAALAPSTLVGLLAPPAAAAGVTVASGVTAEGRVLVGANGLSLYMFSGDYSPATACTSAECLKIWPPLLAPSGTVSAGPGVNAKELGVVNRPGVGKQVTYYGQPLYYFLKDTAGGQTNGEGITSFGGEWDLVSVAGHPAPPRADIKVELTPEGLGLGAVTAFGAVRTLYMLTSETATSTRCTGACNAFWPPLLSSGTPVAGPGVNQSLLGLVKMPDGALQVTYAGHRLRMFTKDMAGTTSVPGAVNGANVLAQPFDGVWYPLSPAGFALPGAARITAEASAAGNLLAFMGAGGAKATAYAFTGKACTGQCAVAWPPVLTSDPPLALAGVVQGELGVVQRSDGSYQVTYYGKPLYLFFKALSTSTNGAGIKAFGGTFEAMTVGGKLLTSVPKMPAATTTTSAPPSPTTTVPMTTTTTAAYSGY